MTVPLGIIHSKVVEPHDGEGFVPARSTRLASRKSGADLLSAHSKPEPPFRSGSGRAVNQFGLLQWRPP